EARDAGAVTVPGGPRSVAPIEGPRGLHAADAGRALHGAGPQSRSHGGVAAVQGRGSEREERPGRHGVSAGGARADSFHAGAAEKGGRAGDDRSLADTSRRRALRGGGGAKDPPAARNQRRAGFPEPIVRVLSQQLPRGDDRRVGAEEGIRRQRRTSQERA